VRDVSVVLRSIGKIGPVAGNCARAGESIAAHVAAMSAHLIKKAIPAFIIAPSLLGNRAESVTEVTRYLIACGLIGLPVPPVMISGGPQKKNS
jgi:hypothetical protein